MEINKKNIKMKEKKNKFCHRLINELKNICVQFIKDSKNENGRGTRE
jgi:hypothetical protein